MIKRVLEFFVSAAVVIGFAAILITVALSEAVDPAQCPAGAKSCKVLILLPDEEQTLTGENMILAHAEWANRAGLAAIVAAWRNKIATAPQGKLAPAETPKK